MKQIETDDLLRLAIKVLPPACAIQRVEFFIRAHRTLARELAGHLKVDFVESDFDRGVLRSTFKPRVVGQPLPKELAELGVDPFSPWSSGNTQSVPITS